MCLLLFGVVAQILFTQSRPPPHSHTAPEHPHEITQVYLLLLFRYHHSLIESIYAGSLSVPSRSKRRHTSRFRQEGKPFEVCSSSLTFLFKTYIFTHAHSHRMYPRSNPKLHYSILSPPLPPSLPQNTTLPSLPPSPPSPP